MKLNRHNKILELISDNVITTQEELMEFLKMDGFDVTQATISRDIKELRLIKTQNKDGQYCYSRPNQDQPSGDTSEFRTLFIQAVLHIDFADNIVVIKCKTGMANAVCVSMDNLHWKGVVGTLSGDDTIFVLMRDKHRADEFVRQLNKLTK